MNAHHDEYRTPEGRIAVVVRKEPTRWRVTYRDSFMTVYTWVPLRETLFWEQMKKGETA